jgi:DNA processing protein
MYWVGFTRISGVGRVRFQRLLTAFGSMREAWEAGESALANANIDPKLCREIVSARPKIDLDAEMERLERAGVRALTWDDEEYPPRLKQIHDLPPVLYIKGRIVADDERSVAVVGTRTPTAYGREAAHRLSHDLATAGITIVSGLARGLDGVAHRAALEAGGRTVGVLGSGLDIIYPREHTNLASAIMESGALVSEHPLGTKPDARNFPRRNRIIAGMTLGTVVVEAGESSGALNTARHALEENREVFAVPGSILSPMGRGCNSLISSSGAKLVQDCVDILEELNLNYVGKQLEMAAVLPADEHETAVLRLVTYDPVHIDDIVRESEMNVASVSSALAMMELRGLVKQVGGMNYIRIRETPAEYRVV